MSENYPCADCRWSPPSAFDGKPCMTWGGVNMDDYISREMALEAISEECKVCGPSGNCPFIMNCWIKQHRKALLNVPAADVRPVVRGRWNVVSFRNVRTGVLKKCVCSVCSFTETYFKEPNFCPNCGADMRLNKIRRLENSTGEN